MQRQKHYRQAFALASEQIQSMDPAAMAARSGAEYRVKDGKKEIALVFFRASLTVVFPEIEVVSSESSPISLVTRIILLHYLMRADGTPPKDDWIPYKEIPGGMGYAGVFRKRVAAPLLRTFGQAPQRFLQAGTALGGARTAFGDVSFLLPVLPRVSIAFILWQGDEEFPPSLQVLFDRTVDRYLSLEDVVVLGEMTSKRLIARGASAQ